MKKSCLLLLTFVFIALISKAQDIITLTNGSQIQAKVLEINPGDVKYKDFNNQDGPVITVQKSGVAEIQYANGIKTVLNSGSNANTGSEGYKREVYSSSGKGGYKKRSQRDARLHGWYFGANVNFGFSNATNSDPSYTTSIGNYSGANFLATKMFNQHLGLQFGLGIEDYAYTVNYNASSPYAGYPTDQFSLNCLTIPVRALYISNSKSRAGLYVNAGVDVSIVTVATGDAGNLTSYYAPVMFTPYIASGVALRSRNARAVWMFGLYYKTTVTNFYSGQQDNGGYYNPGNTGLLNSGGLSISYMGKFGRGR